MLTIHYVHNDLLETIEDVGFLNAQGDEGYLISNPGKRQAARQFPTGATPLGQPIPRPIRTYDAFEIGWNRRFANNWFLSANYTLSRLYGNYAGLASSDEVTALTSGVTSATAQQQTGSIARPGGNVTGLTFISPDLTAKRLQILTEAAPGAGRIGVIGCRSETAVMKAQRSEVQSAARHMGLQLISFMPATSEELSRAFEGAQR